MEKTKMPRALGIEKTTQTEEGGVAFDASLLLFCPSSYTILHYYLTVADGSVEGNER
ncbi:uncharacterized protein G2W53_011492 [Senna tora]|uniref:Uncharacterized protein n=1 Tax=Senna tora TaxID=362788 RepID=A0A834X1D3_9FABA|nr:uncharacterized protein G2W53_011492 [Senna tora]